MELNLTTLYGTSPASGLIARKVKHGEVSSTEGVKVFHGEPPSLWRERFITHKPPSDAYTLRKEEAEALDEIGSIQVVRQFFSSSNDFPVAALPDPRFLILAQGIALQSLQVASQALFRCLEARRILIRSFVHLYFELL